MDFDAFSAEDLTSPDCDTVRMPCGPYWPFAMPVSHLSDKKLRNGFKQNEEVLVWRTVPLSALHIHIYTHARTHTNRFNFPSTWVRLSPFALSLQPSLLVTSGL